MNRSPAGDKRKIEAANWAAGLLHEDSLRLDPISGDASFRRYFRVTTEGRTLVLMDAPPDREDSNSFLDVAARLRDAGLRAPKIRHFDLARGFGLLEDFGDILYRDVIDEHSGDELFFELFDILEGFARRVDSSGLPEYDPAFLQTELNLFTDWYLGRHRRRELTANEQAAWEATCRRLIDSAHNQPQVFVHRDFHSCNLLHTPAGAGIIDFQDAMRGPLNYDFVSLAWDRYVTWPRERLLEWMAGMHRRLEPGMRMDDWVRACDWMGLQRNLKIVGIFARLRYRDGKTGYLEMIPRFYDYMLDVSARYPEFDELSRLLEEDGCAP